MKESRNVSVATKPNSNARCAVAATQTKKRVSRLRTCKKPGTVSKWKSTDPSSCKSTLNSS